MSTSAASPSAHRAVVARSRVRSKSSNRTSAPPARNLSGLSHRSFAGPRTSLFSVFVSMHSGMRLSAS